MLNDDEMDIISSSQLFPEPDDAATNNSYQTEAALINPTEDVIVNEDASQSKDKENTVPAMEMVMFGTEEVETKESGKQNNVEVDNENMAKDSTSSLKIIYHEKEKIGISSWQLSPDVCGASNASQTGHVKVTHEDASQCKDEEENVIQVVENVMFGSEEEITQGSTMEDRKNLDDNGVDECNIKEAIALGEEGKMDDNEHQKKGGAIEENDNEANENARVTDRIVGNSKEETTSVGKQEREKVVQSSSQTVASTLEVKAGSSSQKKKVLKKVEKTGMIFMCSKKTKQDCFDYKVFGLPASKRDVVRKVSKGMRLFLFDIDLRVMYGIYKAAAPGDYNIEPNAFKSAFPSQVQFTILQDCTPLTEEKFRMAIKDNYYRKNMFSSELTSEQVKNLCKLFVASNRGPSLSLKTDDVANSSQANKLSSISNDMDIEGNGGIVKQENPFEKKMDEESTMVSNKGKFSSEEKNEEALTEEEKKNEENLTVEANGYDEKNPSEEEKGIAKENEESANEGGAGMIFMCSSKTKQDCLHYKVFGLPANKRKIVQKVEKGMKLFMFDFNLRLMYGIYKATGPGGYNIEPKAFNSSFPSQVLFTVVKDCPPLTEEEFRVAIKDNYYRKNRFRLQLTADQVKKLCQLFVDASLNLKSDDIANTSQIKETLSRPMVINVEENCGEVTQADQIEEVINEENLIVGNNGKINIKEENEKTATEEERKDEKDFMVGDKNKELMCLEADADEVESASEEGEEEEEEKKEEEEEKEEEAKEGETMDLTIERMKNEEEVGVHSHEKVRKKRKRRREKKLRAGNTGMIFMCSSKTKPDCFHYKVLGLPANKREVVEKIPKGMRLFMFDVELRVMYGIYKAAGPGGYNIEPMAFSSGFPSQVRFTIVEDCLPLEEEKFKVAIKDNYYTKWKFNCELTPEQVKNLCKLFFSANKRRDRIRQQMVVPLAQLPPPAHAPMYGSYGSAYVYSHGPSFQPRSQRRGWSRYGSSRPY